ncbi:hypothetical protein QTP86_031073, partial [Hemibagrus guttatus]
LTQRSLLLLRGCAVQPVDVFTDIFNISLSSAIVPTCHCHCPHAKEVFSVHMEELHLPTHPCKTPLRVTAVDDQPIGKGFLTCQTFPLTLQVGELHFEMTSFYVIRSPKTPLILRFHWLQQHGAFIDWRKRDLIHWSTPCMTQCLKKVDSQPCLATSIEGPSSGSEFDIPKE